MGGHCFELSYGSILFTLALIRNPLLDKLILDQIVGCSSQMSYEGKADIIAAVDARDYSWVLFLLELILCSQSSSLIPPLSSPPPAQCFRPQEMSLVDGEGWKRKERGWLGRGGAVLPPPEGQRRWVLAREEREPPCVRDKGEEALVKTPSFSLSLLLPFFLSHRTRLNPNAAITLQSFIQMTVWAV